MEIDIYKRGEDFQSETEKRRGETRLHVFGDELAGRAAQRKREQRSLGAQCQKQMLALVVVTIFLLSEMIQATIKDTLREHEKLILDKKGLQNMKEVHKNWYFYSIKALLGQLGKELLGKLNSASRERLKLCLKRIVYTKDLRKTAACLLKARERWKKFLKYKGVKEDDDFLAKPLHRGHDRIPSRFPHALRIRKLRLRRSKRSPNRLILPDHLKDHDQVVKSADFAPPLKQPSKSPINKVAGLFVSLFGKTNANELPQKWSTTYKSILKLSKYIDKNENSPGTRVYNARIYDLVMDSKETTQSNEINLPPFLQSAFDVVKSFNGAKNARILSPRFASLLPDRTSTKGFLSPSIFPFYKDDTEQQIMPVPKMLELAGMNDKDRERLLEMIMEVSGARDTVDKAMKVLKHLGLDDTLLSVNENIGKAFEQLQSSFSLRQNTELNKRGFTFMNSKQIDKLHEKQNISEPEVLQQMKSYKRLPKHKREEMLWQSIGELAGLSRRRSKRQANQVRFITTLRPTVLSPYQFAPVYGISVLGPVVLSPNLFCPLILNPSLLSPWVLSPAFPLPFILSPYVLSPYVLSPLAMAPFVLTPYVLSPNVINPYVLSPVILSPIVVCPDILSPMTLGGIILSPNILSPSILSKSYLMTTVLSPSLLS